jgi:uncharacterized protein YcbK (DUF882 family)
MQGFSGKITGKTPNYILSLRAHLKGIHYFEENEIEVGKPMDCQVVVNHVMELTAEEKAEARQNAIRRYQEEELRKLQNRHRTSAKKETQQSQPSLFDLGL